MVTPLQNSHEPALANMLIKYFWQAPELTDVRLNRDSHDEKARNDEAKLLEWRRNIIKIRESN